jgi:Zn-dependent peptidase ImmA (M78 family)/transcriptional regulator with XRE-family HTH domain
MSVGNSLYLVAHQFNPHTLRIAREFRRLLKIELAQKLDLTPSAVSQFESGKSKPNAQTVGRISMALNFPPSFFAQPGDFNAISSDQFHFRSLRSCSQTERRRMASASAIFGRVVEFIDSRVNLPTEQVTPCTSYGSMTVEEIEQAAATVRKSWGLGNGPISNVIHLLESKGILAFRILSDCKQVDAFSHWQHGRPHVFLNTEKGSAARSRFDAIHELGHLILHTEYLPGDRVQEEQANRFASAFLLPRDSFLAECPHRLVWPHFQELKQRWKVSLAALVRRARDLDKISDDTYRRAHVQINKHGWATQEPNEPDVEMPTILPQTMRLLARSGISLSEIAREVCLSERDLRALTFADIEEAQWLIEQA